MAVTGAYLSSGGNAFSTRTASQIIQSHFNPEESNQPGGPLFGVQFSQLTCSDLVRHPSDGTVGPKPAPLGLAAEPGGLPLYKNGAVVGAIGVMATGIYSLDLDIIDNDANLNEVIAVAGSRTFEAPAGVRADHINVDGRSLRFLDSGRRRSVPRAFLHSRRWGQSAASSACQGTAAIPSSPASHGGPPRRVYDPTPTPPSQVSTRTSSSTAPT
jgi:hypothetical protein